MPTESLVLSGLFHFPADVMLGWLSMHAPAVTKALGLLPDARLVGVSTVCWVALAVLVWVVFRAVFYLLEALEFGIRYLMFHARHAGKGLQTRLILRRRRRELGRHLLAPATAGAVDFSSTDLSVLTAAAALAPGYTTSAPELAERLRLRPTEIQRSLEKLYRNKLLDTTLGSTDGFDNYVISSSGAVFTAMFANRRQ